MKHNFTDADIGRAGASAALRGGVAPTPVSTDFLKRFLDHLPEPDDDWQECGFEDIQKGDRVRLVCKPGPLEVAASVVEVEPLVVQNHYITWARGNNLGVIEKSDVDTVYRIPAPVQHPDPAEHPVIIIYRPNGSGETPVSYAWTGQHYRAFDGQEYFSSNEITDWTPAKVVEDDR